MLLFRYLTSSFWFLFGSIWTLVGAPFVVAGVLWGLSQKGLEEKGVRTDARLVEKLTRRDSDGDLRHLLRLAYTDGDGGKHELEKSVGRSVFESLSEGSTLLVVYDPEEPSRASLAGEHAEAWWLAPLLFGGFGSLFAGVGSVLVIREGKKALGRVRLLRQGMVVAGEVVDRREDLNVRVNRRHPLYLVYAFQGPDGQRREGRSLNLPRRYEDRFATGDPLAVVYDPSDPERHEADIYGVRAGEVGLSPR